MGRYHLVESRNIETVELKGEIWMRVSDVIDYLKRVQNNLLDGDEAKEVLHLMNKAFVKMKNQKV